MQIVSLETICMKYQSLFSRENIRKIFLKFSSAEFAQRVIKVKYYVLPSRCENGFRSHENEWMLIKLYTYIEYMVITVNTWVYQPQ